MASTISITRVLEFDAAHRVMGHESKCATLHGHRYKVEITAEAPSLDGVGRVIDFSVIKAKLGVWLDTYWDHTSIIFESDEKTVNALSSIPRNKEVFVSSWNPTAENMATFLLEVICPEVLKGTDVTVTQIVVWETPNCFAKAVLK